MNKENTHPNIIASNRPTVRPLTTTTNPLSPVLPIDGKQPLQQPLSKGIIRIQASSLGSLKNNIHKITQTLNTKSEQPQDKQITKPNTSQHECNKPPVDCVYEYESTASQTKFDLKHQQSLGDSEQSLSILENLNARYSSLPKRTTPYNSQKGSFQSSSPSCSDVPKAIIKSMKNLQPFPSSPIRACGLESQFTQNQFLNPNIEKTQRDVHYVPTTSAAGIVPARITSVGSPTQLQNQIMKNKMEIKYLLDQKKINPDSAVLFNEYLFYTSPSSTIEAEYVIFKRGALLDNILQAQLKQTPSQFKPDLQQKKLEILSPVRMFENARFVYSKQKQPLEHRKFPDTSFTKCIDEDPINFSSPSEHKSANTYDTTAEPLDSHRNIPLPLSTAAASVTANTSIPNYLSVGSNQQTELDFLNYQAESSLQSKCNIQQPSTQIISYPNKKEYPKQSTREFQPIPSSSSNQLLHTFGCANTQPPTLQTLQKTLTEDIKVEDTFESLIMSESEGGVTNFTQVAKQVNLPPTIFTNTHTSEEGTYNTLESDDFRKPAQQPPKNHSIQTKLTSGQNRPPKIPNRIFTDRSDYLSHRSTNSTISTARGTIVANTNTQSIGTDLCTRIVRSKSTQNQNQSTSYNHSSIQNPTNAHLSERSSSLSSISMNTDESEQPSFQFNSNKFKQQQQQQGQVQVRSFRSSSLSNPSIPQRSQQIEHQSSSFSNNSKDGCTIF